MEGNDSLIFRFLIFVLFHTFASCSFCHFGSFRSARRSLVPTIFHKRIHIPCVNKEGHNHRPLLNALLIIRLESDTQTLSQESIMTEDSNDKNLNHLNDDKIHKFTKLLPKLELHAHLNGCIRESTLLELLEQEKVPLTPDLIDLLHIHGSTDSNDSNGTLQKNEHFHYNHRQRSLSQCFQIFPLIHQSVCTVLSLERITREALEDFANENVSYLELRSTPRCLQKSQNLKDQQCSKQEYIRTILHVFQEFQEKEWKRYHEEITSVTSMNSIEDSPRPPLIPRLLISIDRSGTVEEAIENVNLAIELYQSRNDFVVGIDLGGNPLKVHIQNVLFVDYFL